MNAALCVLGNKGVIPEEIESRIFQEFSVQDAGEVRVLFNNYKWEHSAVLFNTILDLAKGNLTEVTILIQTANEDPRDILSANRSPLEIRQAKIIISTCIFFYVLYRILSWLN